MVGKDYGDNLNAELERRFPDLARARNLVIRLFQTSRPLADLGYGSHMQRVMNILSLIVRPGKVLTHLKDNPYLYISNITSEGEDALQLIRLPSKKGFELKAFHDATSYTAGHPDLLRDMISEGVSDEIFTDSPGVFAHLGLYDSKANLKDLNFLVNDLRSGFIFFNPALGLRQKNSFTNMARGMGLAATYHVAWVDEKTKQEFALAVEYPENQRLKPAFIGYRRLAPIADSRGLITPIGKMPNLSKDLVMRVLNRSKVFSGHLVLGN